MVSKNRKKKLDDIPAATMDQIAEKYSGTLFRGSSEEFLFDRIPFNFPPLDDLIGGGLPKKRLTILSGQSNAGKSYLASQAVKSVQGSGGTVAWIDTEMSWDMEWMSKCGVDIENILIAQPTTGEDAFELVRNLMNDGVNLIVLDSIAGLIPAAVGDEAFGYNPMAWQARFVNQSLPRVMSSLKHGSAFLAINQLRASIGPVDFLDSMPGGKAQAFFSHLILQVRRAGWINEGSTRVGFDIEIRNRKSKAGGKPQQACTIPFRFAGGVDIIETFIREFIKEELILQAGAWFSIVGEENKIMGMNGLKKFFEDNPTKFEALAERIRKDLDESEVEQDFD